MPGDLSLVSRIRGDRETETGRQTATEIKTVRDRQAGRQQQKDGKIIDTNTDRDGKERQTDGNSEKVIERARYGKRDTDNIH